MSTNSHRNSATMPLFVQQQKFTMSRLKSRKGQCVLLGLFFFFLFMYYRLQPSGDENPLQNSKAVDKVLLYWYNYSQTDVHNMNGPQVKADDSWLIDSIRQRFLMPPPSPKLPYNLQNPEILDPSMGQSKKIITLLNNKTGGFFVECGALDGETRSNTLYFERFLGWSGLLVEADPINFADMITRQRRAWLSPSCLSLQQHPTVVSFEQRQNRGRISDTNQPGSHQPGFVDVQCLPFWSLLLALNRTEVDYFSLDVEGNELEVLKTIPFDAVDIKTLSVEFIHDKEGKEAIRTFMDDKGYSVDSEVTHPNWLANDYIFFKKQKK